MAHWQVEFYKPKTTATTCCNMLILAHWTFKWHHLQPVAHNFFGASAFSLRRIGQYYNLTEVVATTTPTTSWCLQLASKIQICQWANVQCHKLTKMYVLVCCISLAKISLKISLIRNVCLTMFLVLLLIQARASWSSSSSSSSVELPQIPIGFQEIFQIDSEQKLGIRYLYFFTSSCSKQIVD